MHRDVTIELIKQPVASWKTLGDNISRINDDVLRYKPDCYLADRTNDVVWWRHRRQRERNAVDAVELIKAAKTDVVLFDCNMRPS